MNKDDFDLIEKGIRFIRKPAKMGKRYVFNIPKNYIESGLIDPDETYMIILAKSSKKEYKE